MFGDNNFSDPSSVSRSQLVFQENDVRCSTRQELY